MEANNALHAGAQSAILSCLAIVIDRVALSVGLSVMIVSPVKVAEPIEMPFGMWTRLGSIY